MIPPVVPNVIADAGLDAICQAMESLWSVRSTSESELHAQAALDLGIEHLESAIHSSDNVSFMCSDYVLYSTLTKKSTINKTCFIREFFRI